MTPRKAISGTNLEQAKSHNRRVVIEAIRTNGSLSRAQIEGKFRTYADGVLSPPAIDATIAAVDGLENLASVRKLMDMLRAAPRRATLAAASG